MLNKEPKYVELNYKGQEVEITETATSFYNERQKVEIDLNKVLEVDKEYNVGNNGEINHIRFGLYANEDLVAQDGTIIPKDGLIEVIQVEENGHGKFITDLPLGRFYICEMNTNEAYILNNKKYEINFEYKGQDKKIVKITANDGKDITNEIIRGKISGKKLTEDGEGLSNVTIGIFDTKTTKFTAENAIKTVKTLENGSFEFSNVPYGNWLIKELQTVEGFVLSDEKIPVIINEIDKVVEIEMINYYIRGNITLTKVDEDYPDNKLTGAIFEVYEDSNNNGELDKDDKWLGDLEELKRGIYKMDNVKYGLIFVKEVQAPYGFILDENTYKVFIEENNKTYEVENKAGIGFINQAMKGSITINKTSEDGVLEGFKFLVTGTDFRGNYFEKVYTTNKDGKIIIEGLRIGEYVISEIENEESARYILPESQKLKVEFNKTAEVKFENKLKDIPQTGDNSNLILWLTLFGVSVVILASVGVHKYKKRISK